MDEIKAKQQVVEKIKDSAKILVTVSDSPSVDALSAALALTLLLDKQEKHATSIFSGETPPAIAFLEPEKTFDDTTDSLRDFIIALNKEKADHLRYKVEGDSVKIFITPYKTTIDESDLEYSQGDYNVDLVIALGVDDQDHLDKALEDHGQILHDATIITMTAGDQSSTLGGIDWHDSNSSSLSEMITGLAEALKDDKKKSLLDATIATALLTGIVAETDRFSNEHTSSKVMTVAAALMAAGADQQLIATELQASRVNVPSRSSTRSEYDENESNDDSSDGLISIDNTDPSAFAISHDGETLADLDRRVLGDEKAKEKVTEEVEAIQEYAAEEEAREESGEYQESLQQEIEAPANSYSDPEPDQEIGPSKIESQPYSDESSDEQPSFVEATPHSAYATDDDGVEPALGGTLNATTEQAADDARRVAENNQNRTILSHSYLGETDPSAPVSLSNTSPSGFPGTPPVIPGSVGVNDVNDTSLSENVHSAYAPEQSAPVFVPGPQQSPSGPMGSGRVIEPLSEVPVLPPVIVPEQSPADLGLPLPPPLPDFSQVVAPAVPAIPLPPTETPAILGDILAPEPQPNTAYAPEPSLPPPPLGMPDPTPVAIPPAPSDPGQFQIPTGQQ
jgi:hypothetical protein